MILWILNQMLLFQNIEVFNSQGLEGHTYYEQFNAPGAVIRTGDCVYLRTDTGRQVIQQVESIWMNKQYVLLCFHIFIHR